MTFQQYCNILQSAIQWYDENMSTTKKLHRSVHMSEQAHEDEQPLSEEENTYDITTSVDLIQTNFHDSTRQDYVSQRICPPSQNNTRLPPNT